VPSAPNGTPHVAGRSTMYLCVRQSISQPNAECQQDVKGLLHKQLARVQPGKTPPRRRRWMCKRVVINEETSDSSLSPRDYMSSESDVDMRCGDGRAHITAGSHHGYPLHWYPLRYRHVPRTGRPAPVSLWTADNVTHDASYGRQMAAIYDTNVSNDILGDSIRGVWEDIRGFNPCDVDLATLSHSRTREAMPAFENPATED
jgi:hypothetical protein